MSFQSAQSLKIGCAILSFYFCFECFRTIFLSMAFTCRRQASLACLLHSRQSLKICFVPCGTLILLFLFLHSRFPDGHCSVTFIFTPFVCLKKSAVCNSKIAFVAVEKQLEKYMQKSRRSFNLLCMIFTALILTRVLGVRGSTLVLLLGLVASFRDVTGKNGRALRICRQRRKFSSNEYVPLPVWFGFCSCTTR